MNELHLLISIASLAITTFVLGDHLGPGRRKKELKDDQKDQRLLDQGRRQGHDDIALKYLSGAISRRKTQL